MDRQTLGSFKRSKRSTKGWQGKRQICLARDRMGGPVCRKRAIAKHRCSRHYFRDLRRKHRTKRFGPKPLPDVCACGAIAKAYGRCNRCLQKWYRAHPCQCDDCGKPCRNPGGNRVPRCGSCNTTRRPNHGPCTATPGCRNAAAFPNGECRACRLWRQYREGTRPMCACGRLPVSAKGVCILCRAAAYRASPRGRSVLRKLRRAQRKRDKVARAA